MKGQSKYQRERQQAVAKVARKDLPLLPIMVMMFVSGFAGLVYQVLWMKQLGLLFGNTAHATSITLAAFFAGIGFGSWWWGRRTSASANPLRLYAALEVGIVLTALIYFVILKIFYGIYPHVYESISGTAWILIIKFALSLLLIFPAAFFMGGTIPAIGQAIIRHRSRFGRMAAFIYGTNTLGAALGVSYAAFVLIPTYGFKTTYAIAISLSAAVAGLSWWLSRRPEATIDPTESTHLLEDEPESGKESESQENSLSDRIILPLCFFSGFSVLSLEVLWTRIFAQVHENSVYSFAIILTVVLICLAVGAWISSLLSRLKLPPLQITGVLVLFGGALLLLNPWMLMQVTNDLQPFYKLESWDNYVSRIFSIGFRGIGLTVLALGMVFPFLMKATEQHANQPGRTLGRILAANTLGAISGALICGFILLPSFGMWGSLQVLAAGYLIVCLLLPIGWKRAAIITRSGAAVCLILLFTLLNPTKYPTQGQHPNLKPVKILQTWEGSDCTVTAVEKNNGHISIKINGSYSLGSTRVFAEQVNQSRIPLMIYPQVKSIFNIGFGTGMSAGASLGPEFPNVNSVISSELTPAVVEAAKSYIPPEMTGGIFTDPRSSILIEDGRHYLMASNKKFDMINADLFLPYRRGAGSLYSLDHYQAAAKRLNPDGIYVQWLPLYQITETEFGVIAHTMLEAFGQVTMWHNNYTPGNEKVALIGQLNKKPLPIPPPAKRDAMLQMVGDGNWYQASAKMMLTQSSSTILFNYAGNLTEASRLFDSYPINTDDQPMIEYQTPFLFREVAAKDKVIWMVGPKLTKMIDEIQLESPVTIDPMLTGHPSSSRRLALAGKAFHQSLVTKALGQSEESQNAWERFLQQWYMTAEGK
ncbi:MAG: spermidine synthase [Cryomorphaceae bacterium]|jgi:spermidine synthase